MQSVIPFSLALIIFSMGLTLTLEDFRRIAVQPKGILLGLSCQLLMLPAVALAIGLAFDLSPLLTTGLVLIALCPGGVTSNLASHLAGANGALSVSLTAITSVITVFSLPLLLNFTTGLYTESAGQDFTLPLWPTIKQLAMLTLLPLVLAMLLRHFQPAFVLRHQQKVLILATIMFALVIGNVWVDQWESIKHSAELVGGAVIALNVLTMCLGAFGARMAGLSRRDSATLTLEVGLQNSALAVFIAVTLLGNGELAIPASVYSVVMVCSALFVIIQQRSPFANRLEYKPNTHE